MSILDQIMARCTAEEGDCLMWSGPMVNGSPQIVVDRRYRQARRIVFECANGPIPDGKHPVMKCRNARCLNAEHMRALTTKQIGQLASKEGKFSSPSRRAAIALAKRAKSKKLDAARVEDIKAARTAREAAEKHNIHQSLAARIRRGEAWAELKAASVFTFRP